MKNRQEAEKFLEKYIPTSISQKFPADHGLKRAAYLLNLLNNPQEKFRTIHIAGTSGKGTTAYITSKLLQAHGKKVGLHLSPHLEDVRERMLINNHKISDEKFLHYFNTVQKAAQKCTHKFDTPSYFEVLTAMAMYVFAQEKVNVAVIETGLGGTYDATNTIQKQDKICVITRIGHDHTNILGKTLTEIASQKAGIIHPQNKVITLDSKVTRVFEEKAEKENATLFVVGQNNYKNIRAQKDGITFDFSYQTSNLNNIHLSLLGKHQAENAALALTSCKVFLGDLNEKAVKETLAHMHMKGRMDRVETRNKTVIIDGAHNKQKMKALVLTLKYTYPKKKFTTVLAVKKGKALTPILKELKKITDTLITTTYFKDNQDLLHIAYEADALAKKAESVGFKKVITTHTTEEATKIAMNKKSPLLFTGSLYYLQDIYALLKNRTKR